MRLPAVVVMAFVAAFVAAKARASELLVVSDSAAIGFARGSVLEDGASVKVPAGERLALIDASGRGVMLRGPYDGPLHAPQSGAPQAAVLAAVKAILDPGANMPVGAARKAGEGPQPPDPRLVDISDDATVCVDASEPVRLWRPTPTRRATLFVTRLSSGERAESEWPANEATISWPDKLKIADGESYQFALAGALSKPRVLVKLVPAGDSSVASAKRLADAGCRNQAVTMLEAIAAAGER